MSITIKSKYVVLGLLGAFVAIFLLGGALGRRMGVNSQVPSVEALTGQITHFETIIGQQDLEIARKEITITTQRQALKEMTLQVSDLKRLNLSLSTGLTNAQLMIDSLVKVGHTGKIVVVHDTITEYNQSALMLPFDFAKKDEWLDLRGDFDEKGNMNLGLKMKASVNIITGIEKKTKKPTINIFTDNPYIEVIDIKSYKTDYKPPKRRGIGAFAGYGFNTKNPTEPSVVVGIGLTYDFIRF